MADSNPKVDAVLGRAKQWQIEMEKLRAIILDFPFTEDLKWGWPCYVLDGHNVVLIHAFKEYCAVLFFKGALLKDAKGVLATPGNNTQAGRQMRFASEQEVIKTERLLKTYIREAIEVEKAGLKVSLKKTSEFATPQEFQDKLDATPGLKAAFDALTPGRQRAYLLYFAAAKQAKTRQSRVEKYVQPILDGKGLDD